MSKEENILSGLTQKFSFLGDKCVIIRARRITIEVDRDKVLDVLRYLYSEYKFDFLSTITGLDSGDNLEVIYHINNSEGMLMNIKVFAPKTDPVIKSVLEIYNGATYYEKELEGMFGLKVDGLPAGRHYPLPEDWPQDEHPLLKNWKPKNKELK
ncbi:MAG TPA: NADH-quinone oxidoreductase subunit C [Bacteroidales bacterium]|nr:NADH-quinone oxidoreductase subunit C [Bacteroidales bacterium]HPS16861.1 NADH-quinone oxidoreductase subunit C [Bacteroidales bacterium]